MLASFSRTPRPRLLRLTPKCLIHTSHKPCPSCGQPLPTTLPLCNKCWYISRLPQETKFHDIFGLPCKPNPFSLDVATLKRNFRNAQVFCHPDAWASKGSDKQDIAQAISARVNEAYQCLLKPLSRAEYILSQHHVLISEKDQVGDPELMSEIMEAREAIAEAESEKEVTDLVEENREKIKQTICELEDLIGREGWDEVKAVAIKLRYLEGIDRAGSRWPEN